MPRKVERIQSVEALDSLKVRVTWTNGLSDDVDLAEAMTHKFLKPFTKWQAFKRIHVDDFGYDIRWTDDAAIPKDEIIRLAAKQSSERFKAWMKRNKHTYDTANIALGVSRGTVANYVRGDRVPKYIELACAQLERQNIPNMPDKGKATAA